jgi:hypothetical protein
MTINVYDPGDSVRVIVTVRDNADVATDPTAFLFRYRDAAGTWTTLTYGTDAAVVRTATGVFAVIIYVPNAAASSDEWRYEGEARNASAQSLTVSQGSFRVRKSARLG